MRIRLTGAHNAESAETRLSGLVINDSIAMDAGSLTRSLTLSELQSVRHVFLTHRHYDHVRDVPALVYATPRAGTLHVHGLPDTLDALAAHLMNNVIYSAYQSRTGVGGAPRAQFHGMEPGQSVTIDSLNVTAYHAEHSAPALGFLASDGGSRVYYTGDTGPGFAVHFTSATPPDMLIAEVTYSDEGIEDARRNGHMTPRLLADEIASIVAATHWMPRVVVVHRNPAHEQAIGGEMARLCQDTGWDIMLGAPDMVLTV